MTVRPIPCSNAWGSGHRRCLVVIELANYAMLRRHFGASRSETLTMNIINAVVMMAPSVDARAVARDRIEIEISAASRASLDEFLATCEVLFAKPITFNTESYVVEVTIGAAIVDADGCDEVRLIEEAEQALADAGSERRIVVRNVTQTEAALDRIALARELPLAIANDDLFLQYQPKLHVRRQEVSSLEALIRWRHPDFGLVLPGDFIPLAEQSRDIGPLTLWAIRRAIADQRTLAELGYDLRIFVNIAGVLLTDAAFVRQACGLIEASGAWLGFEITETSVIRDPQGAIANLNVFADIGIVIAIDDYGAGLSSLAYLKQLPARELKIDKMFITQLTSSNRDPLIVRSTIDLAHALEMEVVAEGVETRSALALLSVMGCDMVQGFFIGRPVCFDAIVEYLREHSDGTQSFKTPEPIHKFQFGRTRG